MCGILAVLGGPLPVDAEVAEAALDLQAHRGPDDRGVWHSERAWLGARRLAILDTSSRGHQPMTDESGVVVVFNGEIYNYVELREELRASGDTFRSGCDTEVVLKSYLRWGQDCLARFNGMWGLCVFDPRDGSAFFARDRLGVKPLYVTQARGRISIASEAKSLLHLYPELRRVDELTLFRLLAKGQIHNDERSFYDGVQMVPPAHAAVVDTGSGKLTMWRYWNLDGHASVADEDALESFAAALEDAVRLRMRSDVPVGITLSGGLDSTAVAHGAAATAEGQGSVTAFTSVWDPAARSTTHDERAWARLVAEQYGNVVLEEVPAARGDWLPTLERVAWHLDAPNFSPAVIPLWSIMERARSLGVKVMLEGQGADELLGGYTHHAAAAFLSAIRRRSNGDSGNPFRSAYGYSRTFQSRSFVLWVAREAFPFARHTYRARRGTTLTLRREFAARFADVEDSPAPSPRLGERLASDLTRDILPALLHYGDAVSMAHSVEARQPFLDYRLIELCMALPEKWKVSNGETKMILRRYLRSIGHERIAARKDKQGFPTPIWQWVAADDATLPRRLLMSSDSRILAFCSRERLGQLISHTERKPRTGAVHLYRLIATELWLRTCIG